MPDPLEPCPVVEPSPVVEPVETHALVIGIGAGHPDQVTVEAINAMRSVDVFLVADKGPEAAHLVAVRAEILRRHLRGEPRLVAVPDPPRDRSPRDYRKAVDDWHGARAARYRQAIRDHLPGGGTVGFLVWGDPSLYDSTIRVLDRVGVRYDVVPGVSSVSVLAARHRLVLNGVGEPVTVTTGRRLPEAVDAGRDNIVVMLDGSLACADLDADAWDIWWGANLGTPDEALVAGPLGAVLEEVRKARDAAKQSRGWVMDTYLLRRHPR
jgi:precorrin-6A synthase